VRAVFSKSLHYLCISKVGNDSKMVSLVYSRLAERLLGGEGMSELFYSGPEYFEGLVSVQKQRNIIVDRANEELIARLLGKTSFWKDYLAELEEE